MSSFDEIIGQYIYKIAISLVGNVCISFVLSTPRWTKGSVPSSHARGQRLEPPSRQYLFKLKEFVLVWACFNPSGILNQP